MSEKLEDKAIEVIDKAMDGMDQLTVMLAEVAEEYGPEVVDVGLNVARISAAASLVSAAFGLTLLFLLFRVGIPLNKKYRSSLPERDRNDVEFWGPTMVSWLVAGMVVFGISFGGFKAGKFFDLWNWVGVIEPKLWIAHEILKW